MFKSVPKELVDQLVPGGKMVMPVGIPESGDLLEITKVKDGDVNIKVICRVLFVPAQGKYATRAGLLRSAYDKWAEAPHKWKSLRFDNIPEFSHTARFAEDSTKELAGTPTDEGPAVLDAIRINSFPYDHAKKSIPVAPGVMTRRIDLIKIDHNKKENEGFVEEIAARFSENSSQSDPREKLELIIASLASLIAKIKQDLTAGDYEEAYRKVHSCLNLSKEASGLVFNPKNKDLRISFLDRQKEFKNCLIEHLDIPESALIKADDWAIIGKLWDLMTRGDGYVYHGSIFVLAQEISINKDNNFNYGYPKTGRRGRSFSIAPMWTSYARKALQDEDTRHSFRRRLKALGTAEVPEQLFTTPAGYRIKISDLAILARKGKVILKDGDLIDELEMLGEIPAQHVEITYVAGHDSTKPIFESSAQWRVLSEVLEQRDDDGFLSLSPSASRFTEDDKREHVLISLPDGKEIMRISQTDRFTTKTLDGFYSKIPEPLETKERIQLGASVMIDQKGLRFYKHLKLKEKIDEITTWFKINGFRIEPFNLNKITDRTVVITGVNGFNVGTIDERLLESGAIPLPISLSPDTDSLQYLPVGEYCILAEALIRHKDGDAAVPLAGIVAQFQALDIKVETADVINLLNISSFPPEVAKSLLRRFLFHPVIKPSEELLDLLEHSHQKIVDSFV